MGVLLKCESRVLVSESFADHFQCDPSAERDGGVRVSEVVEPNTW